ncbi:hypothetical protein NHX12_005958 [Muraenolepis orangiensis]|uniref:NACHT domain-containing protein n=1 Tax=Muraenolepis orangiensis TaxID=630683 RepID=A0A9Q0DSB2_9TELE|nr:hypothetical protein NHX12_005958 [Muraenolepis orangiensis]
MGLTVNTIKTEVVCQWSANIPSTPPAFTAAGEQLSVVPSFRYLGSILSEDNTIDNEVQNRIKQASAAFGRLRRRVFQNKNLHLRTKVCVYQAICITTLLYSCEAWVTYSRHIRALEQFHIRCLQCILGITWRELWFDCGANPNSVKRVYSIWEGITVQCQHNIKSHLMQKFRRVFEGIAKAGQSTDLNDFYTELFITERVSGEVNKEHEVRLIETASRKPAKEETPIKCEDIFKPLPGQDQPSRTIMTTGVAGIGKTILTHKFTLDWAEGKANQDIDFTLPFTFRELNLLKEKEFSLMELLHHFFIQTKGIRRYDRFQVVFILDGLDECRLPLDFQNNPIWTDVTKSTSVDVLLTNLIRGDLLPSARIWITTRPAAANQIPAECVDMVTEVRGFTDPQKEEYFRKRFREEPLASKIISHIKTSRSIHIMCHIPARAARLPLLGPLGRLVRARAGPLSDPLQAS